MLSTKISDIKNKMTDNKFGKIRKSYSLHARQKTACTKPTSYSEMPSRNRISGIFQNRMLYIYQ
jgi:hypothetical protein